MESNILKAQLCSLLNCVRGVYFMAPRFQLVHFLSATRHPRLGPKCNCCCSYKIAYSFGPCFSSSQGRVPLTLLNFGELRTVSPPGNQLLFSFTLKLSPSLCVYMHTSFHIYRIGVQNLFRIGKPPVGGRSFFASYASYVFVSYWV